MIETEIGVVLRTDLGTFQLKGADVKIFLERMLPLLDGTRDRATVVAGLAGYSAESVNALLDVLSQYGLIEATEGDDKSGQADFFAKWLQDPAVAAERLRSAQVVVVGLEPWTERALTQLVASGVGSLVLVRGDGDSWRHSRDGREGAEPEGAEADIEVRPAEDLEAIAARLPDDSLLLATANLDQAALLRRVAVVGQEHNLRALYAHIDGFDAVLGPLVVPGDSACWECYRLRRLANADNPPAAQAIEAQLLRGEAAPRRRSYLPSMSALLGELIALETIKVLSDYLPSELVGRTFVQSLITLQTSMHGVVRMPWCPVCGGAAQRPRPREPRSGSPSASLDVDDPSELRERLAGWVDERTGPVRFLTVITPAAPEPEMPVTASAFLAAYTEGDGYDNSEIASGKGLTKLDALRSAAGEAIERYSAARYRRDEFTRAAAVSLAQPFIDPRELCLYDDDQYDRPHFPYPRYDPAQPIDWADAEWFDSGEAVLVPALLTYFNYRSDHTEHFCQVTSNGLAAGATKEDAAVRAVLELVERDAFMVSWLARIAARPLLVDGALPARVTEALRQLAPLGVEIELALLDAGIPLPVVACLAFGDGERWPGLTLALAADTDPVAAATKAILEHGHVGPYIRRQMLEPERPIPAKADEVRTLIDHALFYAPPERAAAARFLLEAEPVSLAELSRPDGNRLEICRGALAAADVRVAVADVTAPDVELSPFRVARALGVHVQPIHFGHGLERRANPRLRALADRPNEMPHPLA